MHQSNRPPPPWVQFLLDMRAEAIESLSRWHEQIVSFDFMESLRRTADSLVHEVGPALARIGDQIQKALDQGMAPNWGGRMTVPDVLRVIELMGETGWSLAWSPPNEVVAKVMAAPDRDGQREVLLRSESIIVDDKVLWAKTSWIAVATVAEASACAGQWNPPAYASRHCSPG